LFTVLVALLAYINWDRTPLRAWTGLIVSSALALEAANRFAPIAPLRVVFYGATFGALAWTIKSLALRWLRKAAPAEEPETLHAIHDHDNAKFNVVFIHGIHGHHFDTWSIDRTDATYWPNWVAADFPDARVYSLQYNAFVTSWMGTTMPLFDRAGNLLSMFENDRIFRLPTMFIVHSYGGLAIKKVWRLIHDTKHKDGLRAVKGIIFLATPHSGSHLANFLRFLVTDLLAQPTVTARELGFGEAELRELSDWYRDHRVPLNYVYFEEDPLPVVGVVVDAVSANPGLPGVRPVGVSADHGTICKPKSRDAHIAKAVRRHLEDFNEVLARDPTGPSLRAPYQDLFEEEIAIRREIGGVMSDFNVRLSDLLIAPTGIAYLLDEYAAAPTDEKWRRIKARAQANHERLENLYAALETLAKILFFGRDPSTINDIKQVIDAKMHHLYDQLMRYPPTPRLRNRNVIADLRQRAHDLEAFHERVEAIQSRISDYVIENGDDYLRLLRMARGE
jgi:hypothetical protein